MKKLLLIFTSLLLLSCNNDDDTQPTTGNEQPYVVAIKGTWYYYGRKNITNSEEEFANTNCGYWEQKKFGSDYWVVTKIMTDNCQQESQNSKQWKIIEGNQLKVFNNQEESTYLIYEITDTNMKYQRGSYIYYFKR